MAIRSPARFETLNNGIKMADSFYDPNNIFAKIIKGELPCHKVYEDESTFAFMDIMPRSKGHCLVIPKAPARNLLDASCESLSAVLETVQKLARACMKAYAADGITIQQFNESAGGQVVFHLHFHVIPRFEGEPLKPHTGEMEDPAVLSDAAEKLRAALLET